MALALSDVFGPEVWKAVEISTQGAAYDLTFIMRRGYYKLEVIQLILMSLEADLTLTQIVKKRQKGTGLSEMAAALDLDFDKIYGTSLAIQEWIDEEYLPWYESGGGQGAPVFNSGREESRSASPADDGTPAFKILKDLVAVGNRHAGAPKRKEAIENLVALMRTAGLTVEKQSFTSRDPRSGRPWAMTNLIGRFRPKASCRFLLGSHFDTRHVAEQDPDPARRKEPIVGANDGTSGVAVLLALAPRLESLLPKGIGADIVLFDGEEMGYPGTSGQYCAGSRHLARGLSGWKTPPRFGIILDMVCAPQGVYKTESRSLKANPKLVDALWDIGEKRAPGAFSRESHGIIDDQVPLSLAGVPSVLIIGYDYPQWHTAADTVKQCSAERLGMVQGVLEEFLKTRLKDFIGGCS